MMIKKLMTSKEFIKKAKEIESRDTIYILGTIGQIVSQALIDETCGRLKFNRPRRKMYERVKGKAHAFDCVGLIKAILWDWKPNRQRYFINGVPDINADGMIKICDDVSSDFNHIAKGEVVWLRGHIGVYVGDGNVIECTPAWSNGVQITRLNQRNWKKHGKLPWIDYGKEKEITVDEAKKIIKEKTGLQDNSINYMYNYRWGDALLIKLAKSMI